MSLLLPTSACFVWMFAIVDIDYHQEDINEEMRYGNPIL